MLQKLSKIIVNGRFWFLGIFLLLAFASLFMMQNVGVNYDVVEYLPENSKTKISVKVMEDEFGATGTASVMISGVSQDEASELARKVAEVEGVSSAVFVPNDTGYYSESEQKALFKLFLKESNYTKGAEDAINKVESVLKNEVYAMSGGAVSALQSRLSTEKEMGIILLIAIIIVLGILFLTSLSYVEPFIFLIVIGVAILINMGTNIFLGEISFVTNSISSVMLIALEMDYSIVLLHRYREEKQKNADIKLAMQKAIKGSFMAIVSSGLTVMAGLIALMFMQFMIGFDIGMVLAKGVFISILAVVFFMPAIILLFDKLIEKTAHKSFLPSLRSVGTFAKKTRFVMPIIFLCVVVFAICLQGNINFTYVMKNGKDGSEILANEVQVEKYFGKQNPLVVMVSKDDIELQQEIYDYIVSYADNDGNLVVNSASALAVSDAYKEISYFEITQMGLSENTAKNIFESYSKDYKNDKLKQIEVVHYLVENNGVLLNDINAKFESYYKIACTKISKSTAKSVYKLTTDDVINLYGDNSTCEIYYLAMYIKSNGLMSRQTTASKTKLQGAIAVGGAVIDVEDIKSNYNFTDEEVANIFALLDKDISEKILVIDLLHILNENPQIIENFVANMQTKFENALEQFEQAKVMLDGENYSRLIFNVNLNDDDVVAIEFMKDLTVKLDAICDKDYYIVCNSYNVLDMTKVFSKDKMRTDIITVFGILLIVLFAFKSLSIPALLVLIIQGAIWINLGITVLDGSGVFFVCYLLAMAIQMGATIDYAILITDRYVYARREHCKFEAIKNAIEKSFVTVITSGSILVLAAFIIHFVSSLPIIADIGLLIGRGALISIITILFVLPQCLLVFDKFIEKTSINKKFLNSSPSANDKVVEENLTINNDFDKSKDDVNI